LKATKNITRFWICWIREGLLQLSVYL